MKALIAYTVMISVCECQKSTAAFNRNCSYMQRHTEKIRKKWKFRISQTWIGCLISLMTNHWFCRAIDKDWHWSSPTDSLIPTTNDERISYMKVLTYSQTLLTSLKAVLCGYTKEHNANSSSDANNTRSYAQWETMHLFSSKFCAQLIALTKLIIILASDVCLLRTWTASCLNASTSLKPLMTTFNRGRLLTSRDWTSSSDVIVWRRTNSFDIKAQIAPALHKHSYNYYTVYSLHIRPC